MNGEWRRGRSEAYLPCDLRVCGWWFIFILSSVSREVEIVKTILITRVVPQIPMVRV